MAVSQDKKKQRMNLPKKIGRPTKLFNRMLSFGSGLRINPEKISSYRIEEEKDDVQVYIATLGGTETLENSEALAFLELVGDVMVERIRRILATKRAPDTPTVPETLIIKPNDNSSRKIGRSKKSAASDETDGE